MRNTVLLLALAAPALSGCTAKYQDLLRDRDAQIRELGNDVAELRAANADLQRRERAARAAAEAAASRPEPAPSTSELERVQAELAGLDVRYGDRGLSIGIDSTVTFSSGSTSLKSTANKVLDRVVNVIKRDYADRRIYVEGHTDTDPIKRTKNKFRDNRHLSVERAQAVVTYLARAGLDDAQLVVVGFGEHDPISDASSKTGKARNRRVEIVVGETL